MVVLYSYLERGSDKVLKSHLDFFFSLGNKRLPPVSAVP